METTPTNIPTKQIVYKGKTKEIPAYNSDPKLCENFIIARARYCKFEKHMGSQFCIYHMPKENEEKVEFVFCPIDPSHRILASKLKRHINVCNKLGEKQRLVANVWYKEKINKVNNEEIINQSLLKAQENDANAAKNLSSLYGLRWEDLSEEEYSSTLDKIIKAYEILKEDYKQYAKKENLEEILTQKIAIDKNIDSVANPDLDFKMFLSGMHFNQETDLDCTKDLVKSEKNGRQNEAISNVLRIFDLLDSRNVYIEFGAGKGGLSHYINSLTKDNSVHILLEREGIRYKRDKYSEGLFRVKINFYLIIKNFF